ncbi:hypothetical protein [Streptococcus sanguinis]|uniref:hypothetical protein n=1 Tax=Streptococcus sanguinis TaxID=1305 RepID=UPI001E5B6937|nr:hypothetical protein [Streptococcus sanguinis]
MKKRSIFKASFEESLNLQDDPISGEFSNKNLASAQEKEKYRGTTKSYVWLTVLTIVFIIGPNWLITTLTNYLYHHSEDSPLLPPVHNFLPQLAIYYFLTLVAFTDSFWETLFSAVYPYIQGTISYVCHIPNLVDCRNESIFTDIFV